MKDGFIKVGAFTPKIKVGDCRYNAEQIINEFSADKAKGIDVIVFPELCTTGYTAEDLFLQSILLDASDGAILKIIEGSKSMPGIVIFGAPIRKDGKLYNCAIVVQQGEVLGVVAKTHLPNYGEFYEGRRFSSYVSKDKEQEFILIGNCLVPFGNNILFCCSNKESFKFGVEICEDVWVAAPPSVALAAAGATIIFNLSASDETIGKADYRRQIVSTMSAKNLCGYVYCDAGDGESTTDMVFSGHDIICENGSILKEARPFEEGYCISEIDVDKMDYERRRQNTFYSNMNNIHKTYFSYDLKETIITRNFPALPFVPKDKELVRRCDEILKIQAKGLASRIMHTKVKKIVLGISGGLDSALALLVCVTAAKFCGFDMKNIIAISMPCFGTSDRTRNNAKRLPEALGVEYREIDIRNSVESHFKDIDHNKNIFDVTYENAQARERTQVLMDVANKESGLVIGTGDLSELALGWATYNGDHMSMYAVNASVPKTLVRHIVEYYSTIDSKAEVALKDILNTPVSPELIPPINGEISQKTEEIVGDYKLHDFFLYYAIRWGFPPKKIFRIACIAFEGEYEKKEILKWLKNFYLRFFAQQFKRSCMPDGPKVGSVTLSPRGDWRMPSDASSSVWKKELDEIVID